MKTLKSLSFNLTFLLVFGSLVVGLAHIIFEIKIDVTINLFLSYTIAIFAILEGYSTYKQVTLSENRNLIEDSRNELEKAYGQLYTLLNKQPLTQNKLLTASEEKCQLDQIMSSYPFMFSDELYNTWKEKIQNIEKENMRDPATKASCIVALGEFTEKFNMAYKNKVERYNKLLKKGEKKVSEQNSTEKKLNDRDFQLEIVKIQTLADSTNSFFTTMIAVAITWIATMFTLSYVDALNLETKADLLGSAVLMLLLIVVIAIGYVGLNYVYIPRRLNKLRESEP